MATASLKSKGLSSHHLSTLKTLRPSNHLSRMSVLRNQIPRSTLPTQTLPIRAPSALTLPWTLDPHQHILPTTLTRHGRARRE